MTAKTTDARAAIWDAIENYSALNPSGVCVFKRKIKHESATGMLDSIIQSSLGDLPSIEIVPSQQDYQLLTNRMAEFPYNVEVRLLGLYLDKLETYAQDIVKAVYQQGSVLTPTVSYVKAATGYHPQSVRVATPQIVALGRGKAPRAWGMVITFYLRFQYDPFGS